MRTEDESVGRKSMRGPLILAILCESCHEK